MTQFDYVVIAIIALSGLLGFIRGFVRESLSLLAYVVAFVACILWGPRFYPWVYQFIGHSLISIAVSYVLVFILALIAVGLVNMLIGQLVSTTGLTPADKGLGMIFGMARGLVIVLVLVTLAGYTTFPAEPWFRYSKFAPPLVQMVKRLSLELPLDLQKYQPYQ